MNLTGAEVGAASDADDKVFYSKIVYKYQNRIEICVPERERGGEIELNLHWVSGQTKHTGKFDVNIRSYTYN